MPKMDDYVKLCQSNYEKDLEIYKKIVSEGRDASFCHCQTLERYQEILKLDKLLTKANIKHILVRFIDGWQVAIFTNDGEEKICDAVQHFGSYGQEEDKIEIMGGITAEEREGDSVLGYLTAEEVAKRFTYCSQHQTPTYVEVKSGESHTPTDAEKEDLFREEGK